MNSDTARAREILQSGGYTCVLCKGEKNYHSNDKGVKPLIGFLESGNSFCGFSAADKTIGAGAAYLYVLLGVKDVWTGLLSVKAKKILAENGISVSFETLVPEILNRSWDGICPIEKAVKGADSPENALSIIREAISKLRKA